MRISSSILVLSVSAVLAACSSAPRAIVGLPVPIAFELGASELAAGDEIVIEELRSSGPAIAPGDVVTVRGTCRLSSHESGTLYFGTTTIESNQTSRADLSSQTSVVTRGSSSFELTQRIPAAGYLHVTLYDVKSGKPFSNVYFGQGDGVMRTKSWSNAH